MKRLLITSGPTREYLDPVRFLSNASSGKMGCALAKAAIDRGWQVVLVSGPVTVEYPPEAEVHHIVTTTEMLEQALRLFPSCDAVIGAAAPCDFMRKDVPEEKISKTDFPGYVEFTKTPDILAALGDIKRPDQIIVAFALETHDAQQRARLKLERKNADYIVLNGPDAIDSDNIEVEIYSRSEAYFADINGPKEEVAGFILENVFCDSCSQLC